MPLIPLILFILVIYVLLHHPGIFLGIIFWIFCFLAIFFVVRRKRRKDRLEQILQEEMQERKRILQSGIEEIDKMQGTEFEAYLKALFCDIEYKVVTTAVTGDFGADLILTSSEGVRIVVQAKRYSQAVGVDAVQQVFSAKSFYECTEAWVITNNTFTKSARELAEKNDVGLIDRERLIDLIIRVRKAVSGF